MREAHAEHQAPARSLHCHSEGCEEEFSTLSDLFDHQRAEHDRTAYECPKQDCSKAFSTKKGSWTACSVYTQG
jgi:uncharacterized Zn-finger protein